MTFPLFSLSGNIILNYTYIYFYPNYRPLKMLLLKYLDDLTQTSTYIDYFSSYPIPAINYSVK